MYIDVGAFHPTFASNTAVLAPRGWRGICIEPNPLMAERLRSARPDDVVLEVADVQLQSHRVAQVGANATGRLARLALASRLSGVAHRLRARQ